MSAFGYPPPNDPGLGPPGGLASAVTDASQTGGSSDGVIHVSKYLNLVGVIYASATAAANTAHDNAPANGAVLEFPAGSLTLDNAQFNKPLTLRGQGGGTFLNPGASGTVFTSDNAGAGAANGVFALDNVSFGGQGASANNTNYDPAVPLVDFRNWTGIININRCFARFGGTHTLFRFWRTGNLSVTNSYIWSGAYGLPFEFEKTGGTAFNPDTITFDNVLIIAPYGALFRGEDGTHTVLFRQFKLDNPSATTLLDHTLSVDAAAGATTITLQTGQGASWVVGDSAFITGDFATESAGRTGSNAEIVRVTGVAGDVLTLQNALRFAHGTNGNTFGVHVLRSGVPISLPSNMQGVEGRECHFEGTGWGVVDHGTSGASWHDCDYNANRFYRAQGGVQDLTIGKTDCAGRSGENYILEIPPDAPSSSTQNRISLMGPWILNTPQVLDSVAGVPTAKALDVLPASGTFMSTRDYSVWDNIQGRPRVTRHQASGHNIVERYGSGAGSDNLDLYYDGSITALGSQRRNYRNVAAATDTANTNDRFISCTGTATIAQTMTLPSAATAGSGFMITYKDQAGGAATHNITVTRAGGDTIDGATTAVINTNFGVLRLVSTGGGWIIV